jgi:hypothetical protein
MKFRNLRNSFAVHLTACYVVAAAVSGGLGYLEGLSGFALAVSTAGAPLFLAYLLRFTFFYEVTRQETLRHALSYLTLAAILIGLVVAFFGTVNILVGVVLGIIVPALTRRVFDI